MVQERNVERSRFSFLLAGLVHHDFHYITKSINSSLLMSREFDIIQIDAQIACIYLISNPLSIADVSLPAAQQHLVLIGIVREARGQRSWRIEIESNARCLIQEDPLEVSLLSSSLLFVVASRTEGFDQLR